MKHIHADLMKQYAEDAQETDKPWKRWEVFLNPNGWTKFTYHPSWSEKAQYRYITKTININGFEVPEPVREPLENGHMYYIVTPCFKDITDHSYWNSYDVHKMRLNRGLIHLTKENAELHAKALLSFTIKE